MRVLKVAIVVLWAACTPKPAPGGKCTEHGRATCADATGALYCRDGTLERIACRGPKGCALAGDGVQCDDSIAEAGDHCMLASVGNHACTPDGHEALVCEEKGYGGWRKCRGPKGCAVTSARVECDQTLADEGDRCGDDGVSACDATGRGLLWCNAYYFRRLSGCRGPKGCTRDAATNKLSCDDTIAAEGDPCATRTNACSVDLRRELTCDKNVWRVLRECTRAGGCAPQTNADPQCMP